MSLDAVDDIQGSRGMTRCRFCHNTIEPDQRPNLAAGASPTGWTHRSVAWLGNRCPDGHRSAEPETRT
jgi:hypothetical protein